MLPVCTVRRLSITRNSQSFFWYAGYQWQERHGFSILRSKVKVTRPHKVQSQYTINGWPYRNLFRSKYIIFYANKQLCKMLTAGARRWREHWNPIIVVVIVRQFSAVRLPLFASCKITTNVKKILEFLQKRKNSALETLLTSAGREGNTIINVTICQLALLGLNSFRRAAILWHLLKLPKK